MIPAATRYEVTTHAISSTLAEKLPCICGSETLTIELSRTSSTVPSITENAMIHLRVEVNSWTSWTCGAADFGVAAMGFTSLRYKGCDSDAKDCNAQYGQMDGDRDWVASFLSLVQRRNRKLQIWIDVVLAH